MSTPVRHGLRRRNTVALLIVAAGLTVIAVTQWRPDWSAYVHSSAPLHTAQPGRPGSIDGQDWRIDSVRRVDAAQPGVSPPPTGAIGVIVTVARSGSVAPRSCTGVLTDGRRRWSAAPIAVPSRPDATTVCERPGLLELAFEVPADVTPTAVDIVSSGVVLLRLTI